MLVLLFGSDGQLGRALLANAPNNVEVISTSRADCDLSEPNSIYELVRHVSPDVIVNSAAYTAVDLAEADEESARAINAFAVKALVAAHAGKLVHISTDFVFDGTSPRAYRPDDARNPISTYGRTKAEGEDHLRNGDLLVRTAWLYAAGGDNFVRTMLRLMVEKAALGVVADQIGAPTWATNLAYTIWGLIGLDVSGTFHHSDAGVATWYDFAVAIQEEALAIGLLDIAVPIRPIPTSAYPTPAARPALSLLDSSATRDMLGDKYTHWRVNLRKMLYEEKALG